MRDIKQIPLINRDKEAELSAMIHSDDDMQVLAARNELVCSNLRLVVKIAHDFKQYRLPFDDLVAEGNIGLIRAAEKFDPGKGAKFSCYAAWWIKQAMRKAIANQTRTIRVPGQCAQKMIHIDKARRQFVSEHQRQPTISELAQLTGYSEKSVLGLSRAATETYSMDDVVRAGSDTTFGEMLPEESEDQHKEAADDEQIMHMKRLLLRFSGQEQQPQPLFLSCQYVSVFYVRAVPEPLRRPLLSKLQRVWREQQLLFWHQLLHLLEPRLLFS